MNQDIHKHVKADHFSKIKDVYIELHDYSFFHKHSGDDKNDRRIIGRKSVREKLTNLITNSETKSGAYLVTGFRGTGKTSIVNTVLNELVNDSFNLILSPRVFRIFLTVIGLSLLNWDLKFPFLDLPRWVLIVLALLVFATMFYWSSKERENVRVSKIGDKRFLFGHLKTMAMVLPKIFDVQEHQKTAPTSRTILQDSIVTGMIYLSGKMHLYINHDRESPFSEDIQVFTVIFMGCIVVSKLVNILASKVDRLKTLYTKEQKKATLDSDTERNYAIYLMFRYVFPSMSFVLYFVFSTLICSPIVVLFFVVLVLVVFIGITSRQLKQKRRQHGFEDIGVFQTIRNHINYGHIIQVKINLGQDDLKEIDVLRLVAKSTYQRYRSWYYSIYPIKKMIWKLLYWSIMLFAGSFLYYYIPINTYIVNEAYEQHYMDYFPSQALLLDAKQDYLPSNINWLAYNLSDSIIRLDSDVFVDEVNKSIEKITPRYGKEYHLDGDSISQKRSKLRHACIAFDYFIFINYYRLFIQGSNKDIPISINQPINKKLKFPNDFPKVPPPILDYIFILFLIVFFFIARFALKIIFNLGLRTHTQVLDMLRNLVENIEANITSEATGNLPSPGDSKIALFSFRKSQQRPILEAKAIENKLIYILSEVEKIPGITIRPRFVYVFDELDKIEPNPKDRDDENVRLEGTRIRQEVISKILANLKHFFNEAKGVFIFIAGREMYDAALADISDRDSSIGSVFNKVIYVDSFFTDNSDGRATDITSMTEWYVCQFLLPEEYRTEYECSLKGYNEFLDKRFFGEKESECRQKIILTLHAFVTYLAFRSNGAPKKITSLFEEFVVAPQLDTFYNDFNLIVGYNSRNLYLYFDHDAQYRIGFTTYLNTPFLMSVSPYIHQLGDKLLISTTFLLDHLYKFHSYGFSWRNLELTPEIVAVNKDPFLRDFITDIVDYLAQVHIRKIPSGLHEFRFNRKISAEIQYMSKTSEIESAAYNFTLDQSLQIKRYYKKRLADLKKTTVIKDGQFVNSLSFAQVVLGDICFFEQEYDEAMICYMDSLQTLRSIPVKELQPFQFIVLIRNLLKLGLTYERKKLHESAFVTYAQASSFIVMFREVELDKLGYQEYHLKLEDVPYFINKYWEQLQRLDSLTSPSGGNTNSEKFLNNLSSYKTLTNLQKVAAQLLVGSFFMKDGKERHTIRLIGRRSQHQYKFRAEKNLEKAKKATREDLFFATVEDMKQMQYFYGFTDTFFFENIFPNNRFNTEKERNFTKFTMQEGLRLLYQPIIARLQVMEKESLSGVALVDIQRAEEEFKYLILPIKSNEKYMVVAEFNNKIGDILFYKNGYLMGREKQFFNSQITRLNISATSSFSNHYRPPIDAYIYYANCLDVLVQRNIEYQLNKISNPEYGQEHEHTCINLVKKLLSGTGVNSGPIPKQNSTSFLDTLGGALGDMGDCLLAMSYPKKTVKGKRSKTVSYDFLNNFFSKPLTYTFDYMERGIIEQSIIFYYYSSLVFEKNNNFTRSNSQLLKLLHLINEVAALRNKGLDISVFIETIEERIVNKFILDSFRAYDHANRPEILKLREFFGEKYQFTHQQGADTSDSRYILNSASVSTDIREVVCVFYAFKLRHCSNYIIKERFVTSYSVLNKQYVRIWELNLRCRINFKNFEKSIFSECLKVGSKNLILKKFKFNIKKSHLGNKSWMEFLHSIGLEEKKDANLLALEYIISDSIYVLSEIIKSHCIFGNNYVATSYSILANTYEKMAFWCELYLLYQEANNDNQSWPKDNIRRNLEILTNALDHYHISPWYNLEMALSNYKKAIEVHSEGNSYTKMIEDLYYLDDDFNDDILHFSLALERFKINMGLIKKRIDVIEKKLESHQIYKWNTYVGV